MALKRSEKVLVGAMMIVGGLALVIGVGLPQWDAFSANSAQANTLSEEIKSLDLQKTNLTAAISLLEKNTNVPMGVNIRTYNDQNKDEIIKAMLDQVVGIASGTGNKFISLAPADAQPLVQAPAPAKEGEKPVEGANAAANGEAPADPNAPPPPPPPVLNTFGYELSVRGTYDSLQAFLRQMDSQKELLEVSGISLVNELNNDASKNQDANIDPGMPYRLTATLRLVLQPEDSPVAAASAAATN